MHYLKSISNSPRRQLLLKRKNTIDCLWGNRNKPDATQPQTDGFYRHSRLPVSNAAKRNSNSLHTINQLLETTAMGSRNHRKPNKPLTILTKEHLTNDELRKKLSSQCGWRSHPTTEELARFWKVNQIACSRRNLKGRMAQQHQVNIGLASQLLEAIETLQES